MFLRQINTDIKKSKVNKCLKDCKSYSMAVKNRINYLNISSSSVLRRCRAKHIIHVVLPIG